MPDSPVIDLAIGLALVFAIFAAMTSLLTELIGRWLGLRADYLLRGIRALVDGSAKSPRTAGQLQQLWNRTFWRKRPGALIDLAAPTAEALSNVWAVQGYAQPLVPAPGSPATPTAATYADVLLRNAVAASQGTMRTNTATMLDGMSRQDLRRLPSYLSSRSFAQAVIALLVPNASGMTTLTQLQARIALLDDGVLKRSLQTLVVNANGDIASFRTLIEQWYDDHMARVSGWYKRHTRWISLAVGAALVVVFNVSAISVADAMYTNKSVRDAVVAQALGAAPCSSAATADTAAAKACLDDLRKKIDSVGSSGLPVGWVTPQECAAAPCSWLAGHGFASVRAGSNAWDSAYVAFLHLLGWLLAAAALTPGARFWFDLLGRLGSWRSTGPKPSTST